MQVATGPTTVRRGLGSVRSAALRRLGRSLASRRLVRSAVVAVIAVGAAVVPAGAAVAKPTLTPEQKAAAVVLPAVVYLEINWEGWVRDRVTNTLLDARSVKVTSRCSGFAVSNNGYIVTAPQCLDAGVDGIAPEFFRQLAQRRTDAGQITASEQAAAITDMMTGAEITGENTDEPPVRQVYAQRGSAKVGLTSGEAIPAQIIAFDPPAVTDIGLVKIEKSNQPMLTLADTSDPADLQAGADVLTFGYPPTPGTGTALQPSDLTGKLDTDRTQTTTPPVYEISAATTQTMTGGPVVNLNGEVIGLVTPGPAGLSAPGPATVTAPAYNVLTLSSVISASLTKASVPNELGKIDKDYRAGLTAYYDGRYTAAIEAFDQVLAAIPSQAQAQQFRQDAVSLRNSATGDPVQGEAEDSLVTKYGSGAILVAAVLVLLAGLILGARWRHRLTPPTPVPAPEPAADPVPVPAAGSSPTDPPADQVATPVAPVAEQVATPVAEPVADPETVSVAAQPSVVYCTNCSTAAPAGAARCETCRKDFA